MGFAFNFNRATEEQRTVIYNAAQTLILRGTDTPMWSYVGAISENDFFENKPFKKQREAVRRFEQLIIELPDVNVIEDLVFKAFVISHDYGNSDQTTLEYIAEEIDQDIRFAQTAFPNIDFEPLRTKLEAHFKITPEILAKRKEELDAFFRDEEVRTYLRPVIETMKKESKKIVKFDPSKRKPK